MARNTYFNDEIIKDKFNSKQLLRILKYAIPYKKTFLLVGFLMIFAIGLSLLPALFIKYIIDTIIPTENRKLLYIVVAVFLCTGALDIFIQFFNGRMMAKTGHNIIFNIREDVFAKLQTLSFDFFDNRPMGKIVVRLTNYIDELAGFFANQLLSFIINILRLTIVIVFLFILNTSLAAIVLLSVVPMAIFIIVMRNLLKKVFRVARNKDSNRVAYISENISGAFVTKSFNRSNKNSEIYKDVYTQSFKAWRKIIMTNELFGPGVEGLWNIGTLAIYITSVALIASGSSLQTGTVIAFVSYLGMFTVPLNQIAGILQQFASVSSNLERIFETIDTDPIIKDTPDSQEHTINGNVSFKDVTFSYDGKVNILENFNLDVPKGKTIALVGPTGAGKSTVVNLIPRFYDINAGRVMIDGVDVRDYTLNSLRSQIGIMMQDSFIFKGTILDNIRYNSVDASDEECINAAKTIYADEFIQRLPKGYHTELNERGDGLSSGEKQLLSFARIVLRNPKILILDEATSSIDTNTEEKIQKALETLLKGRTSFVIAHRLSTIKNSDCILYIANKGIAEAGTHDDLIKEKGLYYKLTSGNKKNTGDYLSLT